MATDTRLIQDWTPDSLGNPQGYSPGAANYVQIPDDYFKGPERQSYPVPKDGSHIVVNPPVDAKSLFIVNMSTQTTTVRQPDSGEYYAAPGSTAVIPLRKGMAGGQFELFVNANYTGNGLIEIWFDENFYPPIVPFGSSLATAVTISGQPVEVATFAGDIAAGSAVAGAFVDGAIASIGATTDAAQTGANGSVIAQLKGLFNRIVAGSADALATTIGVLGFTGFNGATFDRLRTLASTGFGLGALLVGRVYDTATVTTGFAAIAAGNVTIINNRLSVGIDHRTLAVNNGTNVTLTITVAVNGPTLVPNILVFTLTSGSAVLIARGTTSAPAGYTKVSGNEALLDAAENAITVSVAQAAGATNGNLIVDLIQEG